MSIRTSFGLRTALVAVAAIGWWTGANAQLTPANTQILNRATVNYSVGGQPQTEIESSPNGNTTPGEFQGEDTVFRVDNRVDFTVSDASSSATVTTPGAPTASGAVLAFLVTNTGNAPQAYQLSMVEEATGSAYPFGGADTADFGGNLLLRVDDGNGTYDGETAVHITSLAPNAQRMVFVVASPNVPFTLANGALVNVRLTAMAAEDGDPLTLMVASTGANDPDLVEVVFADDPLPAIADGIESAVDQFAIESAALEIQKTQTVISDGFSATDPKAIPGATVEYVITIDNSTGTTDADAVSITDQVPPETTFLAAQPVVITGGAAGACTGDADDTDTDGCGVFGGELRVASSEIGNVAAGATVTVAFRVTIN